MGPVLIQSPIEVLERLEVIRRALIEKDLMKHESLGLEGRAAVMDLSKAIETGAEALDRKDLGEHFQNGELSDLVIRAALPHIIDALKAEAEWHRDEDAWPSNQTTHHAAIFLDWAKRSLRSDL